MTTLKEGRKILRHQVFTNGVVFIGNLTEDDAAILAHEFNLRVFCETDKHNNVIPYVYCVKP